MGIVFTRHAIDGMKDRRIARHVVEAALRTPDEVLMGHKDRQIAQKVAGTRLLRVVFEVRRKTYIVVTAYYTRIGRYLGR